MIELHNLNVRLGLFSLREVTTSIESGEYFVVTGPSGSGKTVLLETLIGLNTHYRGRVLLDGVNMRGVPIEARSIAYVPQDYGIFPHLSVRGNLLYGARERGLGPDEATARLEKLIEWLGLHAVATRMKATGLSMGEQHRVAIARALLAAPTVLVLDEPMAFLDEALRRELMLQLKKINKELGVTIVHATRDLDEALGLGTRIGVLIDGGLHQVTRPEEGRLQPSDATVGRWIAGRNVFQGVVRRIDERTSKATVQCGEAELAGSFFGSRPAPETAVLTGVRPREVSLLADGAEPTAATNVLEGSVQTVLHCGSMTTVVAEVPKMQASVEVAALSTTARELKLGEGAPVRLAISSDLLWVLPRE